MQTHRIRFNQIDFNDDSFCLAPHCKKIIPEKLKESIKRTGILHPPIIREKREKCFQIISGWKRLHAAKESGQACCDCLVMTASTTILDGLAIALEEMLLNGKINPIEQAIFFRKVSQETDDNEAAERFLPPLGFPPRPNLLKRLIALLDLEEPLVVAVQKGRLDEKVALELGKLDFGDRMALFEVINLLHLSVGNQKKLTISSRELAVRSNSSIRLVLSNPEAEAILTHPEANLPQKAANLMAWINRKRFPRLSEAEQKFRRFTGKLQLPKGVALSHIPSFEKDELTLTITVQDQDKLQELWPKLEQILSRER